MLEFESLEAGLCTIFMSSLESYGLIIGIGGSLVLSFIQIYQNKMKHHIFLIGLLAILCFSCQTESNEEATFDEVLNIQLPERPNIIWLVAEDLSPFIPSFGDSTVETPNLSRLAAEGVCFDQFFSPSPVCAPSRAAIATGMYPTHIGANHMRTGPWFSHFVTDEQIEQYNSNPHFPKDIQVYEAMPEEGVKMFSEYLRAEGYYCTNNAKEDYQFRCVATAWDETSNKAHWRNRAEGQPFFSVFNFGVTHESRIWAKASDSLWVDPDLDVPVPPYLPATEVGKRDIRRMYSNIKEMDFQVGEILDQLEEDGLLERTIIFWYTDHGGPLPRMKRLLYDSGIKVPMIIRFPGAQQAKTRDDRMISFIDLAPTVLSLVGIQPMNYFDGKAFLGQYAAETQREYIFGAADRFDGVYDRNRSVRNKQFKYIKYYHPEKSMFLPVAYREQMPIMQELHRLAEKDSLTKAQALWFREEKPAEELFDVIKDPYEINNLADDPAYAEELRALRSVCEDWTNSFFDTGSVPEPELIKRFWPEGNQPVVEAVKILPGEDDVTLTCQTPGASLGYKIIAKNGETPDHWEIYTQPVHLEPGQTIQAIGDRIGYRPSEIVQFSLD